MTSPARIEPATANPLLAVYVVWHPEFAAGQVLADALRSHFRNDLFGNVTGGLGVPVYFRSDAAPGACFPLPIPFDQADTTAVVVLLDDHFCNSHVWRRNFYDLVSQAAALGFRARVFPVTVEAIAPPMPMRPQAIRWDRWKGAVEVKTSQLIGKLAYELCRMLRYHLAQLEHPERASDEGEILTLLEKVQVFLSHSKHDEFGVRIAQRLEKSLREAGVADFFDVYDIPAGLPFDDVLLAQVRVSAVVAIHSDSYSSREWCRREILEAKRWQVPLIVANCLKSIDERSFPYLGNVPIVRLQEKKAPRVDGVVRRLLDEVLRDFLWKCLIARTAPGGQTQLPDGTRVRFLPRQPELLSLMASTAKARPETPWRLSREGPVVVVYPDPPLAAEEERLCAEIAPHVQFCSYLEWCAGATR